MEMQGGQRLDHHANESRAKPLSPRGFTVSEEARSYHAANSSRDDSESVSETAPLVRVKMLLNNSPQHLRQRALMLDGPPRGRSWVALRKRKHSNDNSPRENAGTRKQFRSRSRSQHRTGPIGLLYYPPYIPVPGVFSNRADSPAPAHTGSDTCSHSPTRTEMLRGSTCQLIMQLLSEYKSVREVLDQLPFECDSDDAIRMVFEVNDIQAIARHCREHGLTAHRPLQVDAEDWEGEEIEEWWHDAMEEGWRDDPVEAKGWWTKLESRQHRDWARWPSTSIGPRSARKPLRTDSDF